MMGEIILAVQAIIVAFISYMIARVNAAKGEASKARSAAEDAREQVTNNHSINLRDDIDSKFNEIHVKLDEHRDTMENNAASVKALSGRIQIIEQRTKP